MKEPMYFDDMDDYYKEIHSTIHELVKKKGWKEVYYAILKYQSEEVVSGYKLIDAVSYDYQKLLKISHQSQLKLRKDENSERNQ